MSLKYQLRQTGAEVQAAIDKIIALEPGALDAIGIYAHDSTYWEEHSDFVPELGALLIYSDQGKFKLGNGEGTVAELPFLNAALEDAVIAHIYNDVRHITSAERQYWNSKSDFSGRYQDLTGRPFVPTKLSDLNSDSGHRTVSDAEKAVWDAKVDQSQIQGFVTKSVNDLVNYYLKGETYTKEEVQQMISAVQGVAFVVVSVLPTASADTMHKIYLVPSADPQAQNIKDEYITIESSGSYTWEIIGSTAIDLSGYVTTTQLNTALAAYTTSADLTTLLSGKQDTISDLSDIRSGAAAGATAYQKPSTGIPSSDIATGVIPDVSGFYTKPSGGIPTTDLSSEVQTSLALADTALQSYTETDPTVPAWAKAANKPSYDYSEIGNTPTIPDELADLADDSTHRLVTDTEKNTWNAKQAALVSGTNIKTINNESLLGSGNITIQGGGGISTITLTFTPNEGETYFKTKAQAATALGITADEVDSLMAGDYDRLIFNGLYADKSTPGQVTSDAAYQQYVAADYNGVPYSLYLIYEDGGYSCWWERQVPALSTSIYSDGNSYTKAATPKSVKDYIDDLPIPRLLRLGAFTPTESSSYISLGNASAAAASLNIEEEELYNLYDGAYNRLVMYDIATGKVRIAHDALRIDEGGGATYEMLAPDGTPYVLDFLYESSAYKYRYYSVVGDIATILASI